MTKRVLSLLMVFSILCVTFSGCAVPANATGTTIDVSGRYYETVIEPTSSMMEVPFTVPFNGYYIIQVFGVPDISNRTDPAFNGSVVSMELYSEYGCVASTHGLPYTGYGRGQLLNCELIFGVTYTLYLELNGGVEELRLSFTHARDLFFAGPPITFYDDIHTDGPNIFEFTFDENNEEYAQVARVICGTPQEGTYRITLSGGGFEQAYVLDPSSTGYYSGVHIYEGDSAQMYLKANVPYYIVVYAGDGDDPYIPVDTLTDFVEFELIG